MRQLNNAECVAIERYFKQHRQFRRIQQLDLALETSNLLMDRIAQDVGAGNDALMANLMNRKAANYRARVQRRALLRFVVRLLAVSSKRLHAIKEIAP